MLSPWVDRKYFNYKVCLSMRYLLSDLWFTYSRRKVLFFVIIPILFWIISMYPAVLTPDSYIMLRSLKFPNIEFDPGIGSTPMYSLFIKIFGFNGNFLLIAVLIQCIIVYVALLLWVLILLPKSAQKYSLHTTGVLFLTPFFGSFAVTLWKDVPSVGLTMIALAIFSKRNTTLFLKIFAAVILGIGASFRYESQLVLILFACILLIIFFISKNKGMKKIYLETFFCILVSMFICNLFSISAKSVMDWKSPGKWFTTQSFLLDLEYVYSNYPDRLDLNIQDLLNRINTNRTLVGIDSCEDVTNFYTSNNNWEQANLLADKMPKLWISAFNSNAREALVHARFCRTTAFLPWPFFESPRIGFWPIVGHGPNELKPNRPEFVEKITYPIGWAWSRLWTPNGNKLGWPGFHFSLIVLFMTFFWNKKNFQILGVDKLIALIPIAFLTSKIIVLFAGTSHGEFRYFPHVYFLSLPILASFFLRMFFCDSRKIT